MRFQKLIRFGLLFAARIAGAASLFAVNLLIVRYLGLDSLATFAVFVSLVSILGIVISTGFPAIAPIFVAEYASRKQPELLKGFTRTALKQGGLLVGFLVVLAVLVLSIFTDIRNNNYFGMAAALIAAASATAFLGFNGAVFVGMKKQIAGLLPETFVRPTLFLLLSLIFLSTGIVTDVSGIIWLLTFSIWLTLGLVLFRDRRLHREMSKVPSDTDRKRWRNASLPWMGISLLWDFMIDLVLLLTSLLAGSIEIAILHICFRYRVLAGFGMRTIHTLLMPEIAEHSAVGDTQSVARKLSQLNLASLAYSVLVMTGFMIFGKWLLEIFSINAAMALPMLLIVSATMVIRSIFGPAPLVLAIHQFHKTTLWVSLAGFVAAAGFITAAFGQLGVLAAAIGYTGANLFISSVLWYIAKKKTGINCSIWAAMGTTNNDLKHPIQATASR